MRLRLPQPSVRWWPGYRPFLLALLLLSGLAVAVWGPWDAEDVVAWGELLVERPWLLLVVVVLQAALFTLALPGSLFLWVVAPFYPPWMSTLTLVAGSTLGALGAYGVAWLLGRDAVPADSRWIRVLRGNSDFLSQCAIRALPGFPHPPLNYGAGWLGLPLKTFVVATVVGLGIKWGVFSLAIYSAVEAAARGGEIDTRAVVVLLGVAVLFVAGAFLRRRLTGRGKDA
ncbi:MAG: VTT domain-containing protein [Halorhodospira halophila]|uniref:TVP38/TMEM64 family protein n=1 Tax=Halorhodospira TaxID=85108 RepID=UPI0019148D3D|nr:MULTISPECIES: VTT domain-containing protein [Halorhodospira]MBK5944467.1 hypothetical protein [Halorhodospira halophila]MCC3750593.1 VTT domain-containing protein [Halorhodospira halophila]MCG5527413.1 VTT domain-containing protein [Halorhodospira halophila]MCG5532867.1 VTT domain-containing protein [Halorhodospira sp. 9621]MCG5538491.1 VTT domain-containing protein [Halorhodospira sp. 9622]